MTSQNDGATVNQQAECVEWTHEFFTEQEHLQGRTAISDCGWSEHEWQKRLDEAQKEYQDFTCPDQGELLQTNLVNGGVDGADTDRSPRTKQTCRPRPLSGKTTTATTPAYPSRRHLKRLFLPMLLIRCRQPPPHPPPSLALSPRAVVLVSRPQRLPSSRL